MRWTGTSGWSAKASSGPDNRRIRKESLRQEAIIRWVPKSLGKHEGKDIEPPIRGSPLGRRCNQFSGMPALRRPAK
jgi:hypothetical protein